MFHSNIYMEKLNRLKQKIKLSTNLKRQISKKITSSQKKYKKYQSSVSVSRGKRKQIFQNKRKLSSSLSESNTSQKQSQFKNRFVFKLKNERKIINKKEQHIFREMKELFVVIRKVYKQLSFMIKHFQMDIAEMMEKFRKQMNQQFEKIRENIENSKNQKLNILKFDSIDAKEPQTPIKTYKIMESCLFSKETLSSTSQYERGVHFSFQRARFQANKKFQRFNKSISTIKSLTQR